MGVFVENPIKTELIERINELTFSNQRLWRMMSVNEMLCHLSDQLLCVLNEKEIQETGTFLHHTLLK